MHKLLHAIWSGQIEPAERHVTSKSGEETTHAKSWSIIYLNSKVHLQYQSFGAHCVLEKGLTLADVIAEEFGILVSEKGAVVICPASQSRPSGVDGWATPLKHCLEVMRI